MLTEYSNRRLCGGGTAAGRRGYGRGATGGMRT
jgi:hypothetical protein